MKGIILAGGHGTRMLPSTRVTNKHLLPIYSAEGAVPMLFYPIYTLVRSGITDILIISSREHCGHIIENLGDGQDFGADFSYKVQDLNHVTLGIASALRLAEGFVCENRFAVILGDNFFQNTFENQFSQFDNTADDGSAMIFVKTVDDPQRFGVLTSKYSADMRIEEKPKNPKTNWAVTGLYLYTPGVFEIARKLRPSNRGELEITDINNCYCNNSTMSVHYIEGFWSDMGTPTSAIKTQEFLAIQHE